MAYRRRFETLPTFHPFVAHFCLNCCPLLPQKWATFLGLLSGALPKAPRGSAGLLSFFGASRHAAQYFSAVPPSHFLPIPALSVRLSPSCASCSPSMIWVPSAGLASLRRPSFPFLTLFSSIRYGASLSPRVLRLSSLSDLLFFAPPPLLSLPIMIHRHPVRIPLLGVIDSLLVFGGHFWSLWDTYRQISTGYRQGYPQSYGIVAPASSSEPPCQRKPFWNVRWAYERRAGRPVDPADVPP